MKMPDQIDGKLLSPCGVNCMACSAYLRIKNRCAGCLVEGEKTAYCEKCARKRCAAEHAVLTCAACQKYPCVRIKPLNKRYLERYGVDLAANCRSALELGIDEFMIREKVRWTCPDCGGIRSQHDGKCSECGRDYGQPAREVSMAPMDIKKEEKQLYQPKSAPVLIDVPEIPFIMINGKGNPNNPDGEYTRAVELLYGLSYTIKMSKMGTEKLEGYFDFVVPPLEGLWSLPDGKPAGHLRKEALIWISMIRVPAFVTPSVFEWACNNLREKKELDASAVRLERFTEGLCVHCMHVGPFDDEPATIEKIERFIVGQGLANDISDLRHHHEIYLSDPRKGDPAKTKTIIRIPVRKA